MTPDTACCRMLAFEKGYGRSMFSSAQCQSLWAERKCCMLRHAVRVCYVCLCIVAAVLYRHRSRVRYKAL